MALTKCKECGHQISKSAVRCPGCGAKIKKTTLLTKLVVAFIGLLFLGAVVGENAEKERLAEETSRANAEKARLASLSPEARAAEERRKAAEEIAKKEKEMQTLGLMWNYHEDKDAMGRGVIKQAFVRTANEFQFDFPYQGSQRATLALRIHPEYGRDVILTIEKGQFLCGLDDCNVLVRFDNDNPAKYRALQPADHRTTTLFIQNYNSFLSNLRKSKRVYIEAPFFQEGNRVFEFHVENLKWQ